MWISNFKSAKHRQNEEILLALKTQLTEDPAQDSTSIQESKPIIVSNIEVQEQIPKETTQITPEDAAVHKKTSLLSKTLGIFSHKSSKEPQQSSLFAKRA